HKRVPLYVERQVCRSTAFRSEGRKNLAGAASIAAVSPGTTRGHDQPASGRPIRTLRNLERARRFERPTLTLARLCSTPELRPRSKQGMGLLPSPSQVSIGSARRGYWATV